MGIVNFTTTDQGQTTGTATAVDGVMLQAGDQLSINGSTDLSAIIVGLHGALVNAIAFPLPGDDGFVLDITGQGPAGLGSGSLKITVAVQYSSPYWIKLDSSTNKTRTLNFETSGFPFVESVSWVPSDL